MFKTEKEHVLFLYVMFSFTFLMVFIPSLYASLVGLLLCLFLIIGLYSVKSKSEEGTLAGDHSRYLIKTFWRANLFLLYSFVLSAIYLVMFIKYQNLINCMDRIPLDSAMNMDIEVLEQISNSCIHKFISENKLSLSISALIAFGPVVIYLAIRITRGWLRVVRKKAI